MYRITTFGGVEVRSEEGELQRFRSRKHVALLVYLRSNPRRVHLREKLAGLFWQTESSLARHSLSQALYDIRSTLGQVVVNCPGDAVRIEMDRLDYDVEELERAVKGGGLPKAVELYTASFAPDLDRAGTGEFQRWLEGERTRLSVLGQTALRQFLTYADNRGEWGEMCSAALRLIRMNPLDEEAHRALMRGLWLHGDQTSALEHFREIRERLDGELPEGISEDTLQLIRRIQGSRPQPSDADPPPDRHLSLVGRQKELEILAEFADQSPTRSEPLIIRGEAGIGKTRLVEELEKLLTLAGQTILKSQCYAAEAEVGYGPVLDGLRDIAEKLEGHPEASNYRELGRLFPSVTDTPLPSTDASANGQSARRRLFEEIADMIRRASREEPLVWIVEDIHCIDGASSALLHYLSRRLASEPFRLVVTTRPESQQNEPARDLLNADFFVGTYLPCDVQPLDTEAVGQLVAEASSDPSPDPELVEKISNLSGGNPFYAVELSRVISSVNSDLHASHLFQGRLNTVLRARLKGLPSEAVCVLNAVAVLGPHAKPRYIQEMCNLEWTDISECCEFLHSCGILKEASQSLTFAHDITREFVYKNIGFVARSASHLKAAELLASNSTASPSTIALHFKRGGNLFRSFEYAIQAARVARSRAAYGEAQDMSGLAIDVAVNEKQRFQALQAQEEAARGSGDLDKAREGLENILSILENTENTKQWLNYSFSLLEVLLDLSDWMAADALVESLQPRLRLLPAGLRQDIAQLQLGCMQLSLAVRSKSDETVDEKAATLRDRLNSISTKVPHKYIAEAYYSLAGYAAFYRSAQEATEALTRITAEFTEATDEQKVKAHLFLGGINTKLGEWDKANYNLNSGLRLTTSMHDVVNESAAWNNIGCMHLEMGNWQRAEECFERAINLQKSTDLSLATRLHSDINIANALFYKGRPRKANRCYRECLNFSRERGLDSFQPELRACIGLTSLQTGDIESAVSNTRRLRKVSEAELRGIQERYKVDWLLQFMSGQFTPEAVPLSLGEVADRLDATDRISALKLRWLDCLIGDDAREECLSQTLRSAGLYWFVGFSKRWLRSVDSKLAQNQVRVYLP